MQETIMTYVHQWDPRLDTFLLPVSSIHIGVNTSSARSSKAMNHPSTEMAQSCLTLVAKKFCSILSALPLALRKLPRPPLTEVQKPDPRPDQRSIPEHHLAVRPVRVGLHRCRLHHCVRVHPLHLQSRRFLQLQGQQLVRQ